MDEKYKLKIDIQGFRKEGRVRYKDPEYRPKISLP